MTTIERRWQRIENAIQMKPVDKIPFSYSGPAYLAREMGMTIKDFVTDYPGATDAAIRFLQAHPGVDSIHSPMSCPASFSCLWLSPVLIPGRDLPDDALWQVGEQETITEEDYDVILSEGYGPWMGRVLVERLGDPLTQMAPYADYEPICYRRLAEAQIPVMNPSACGTPFEHLCGGRTLMNFFVDLVEDPDKILQVLDKVMEVDMANLRQTLAAKPKSIWIGGWRAAPELLSHDTWMEFVWPYLRKLILTTVEAGTTPILHFDSCWERELVTLRELPARKCLLMLDGSTNMRKAREVLDDRMCLMGDVPARMLAFGTADEVHGYVTDLIDDVGPRTGLIVSSGCDVPLNAKKENVAAMIDATCAYM